MDDEFRLRCCSGSKVQEQRIIGGCVLIGCEVNWGTARALVRDPPRRSATHADPAVFARNVVKFSSARSSGNYVTDMSALEPVPKIGGSKQRCGRNDNRTDLH